MCSNQGVWRSTCVPAERPQHWCLVTAARVFWASCSGAVAPTLLTVGGARESHPFLPLPPGNSYSWRWVTRSPEPRGLEVCFTQTRAPARSINLKRPESFRHLRKTVLVTGGLNWSETEDLENRTWSPSRFCNWHIWYLL